MKKLAVLFLLPAFAGCITQPPVGAYLGERLSRPPYQAKVNLKASEQETRANAYFSSVINVPSAAVAEELGRRMGVQVVPVYQPTKGVVLAEVGPVDDLSRFMVVQSLLAMTEDPCRLVLRDDHVELEALKPVPRPVVPAYAPPYPPVAQPGGYYQPPQGVWSTPPAYR